MQTIYDLFLFWCHVIRINQKNERALSFFFFSDRAVWTRADAVASQGGQLTLVNF
jgi:hypothetical protein